MRRTLASLIVLALAAVPATASTFAMMSFPELVEGADAIVVGRIQDLDAHWTQSGRLIVTDNAVRVDEVWVGTVPRKISVRTIGGEVSGFAVEALGFPKFEKGERVILFLKREPESDTLQVFGYQLGHWRFVERLDGKQLAVPQTDEGMHFVDGSGQRLQKSFESWDYHEFKATVLEHAKGRGVALNQTK